MKISVITPNYNYAKYIGKTIESVVLQDYENIEHVIVDDGSTDNSVKIIKEYRRKYPDKIKLITQSNQGQSKALNTALSYVTGDIIAWINSDDYYISNDVFTSIINTFNENSDYDAIFGNIVIIDSNNRMIREKRYFKFDYKAGVFLGFGRILSSNSIFWKRIINENIFFNENYLYSMDAEFFSKLLYKKRVYHINKALTVFRFHENAKTTQVKNKISMYNHAVKEKKRTLYNSYYNLSLARYVPYKFIIIIIIYYKTIRTIKKLLYGYNLYK